MHKFEPQLTTSYVGVYEHTGEPKTGWPKFFPDALAWNMPIVADINGDGLLEIGFSMDIYTYFVDINGNPSRAGPQCLRDLMDDQEDQCPI